MTSDNDLPSVEGLHEGDSGDEVRRVQRYLERFGYLESANLDGFEVPREMALRWQRQRARSIRTLPQRFGHFKKGLAYR
jgi:hypothetical protein